LLDSSPELVEYQANIILHGHLHTKYYYLGYDFYEFIY
jgi:hypothetical protein